MFTVLLVDDEPWALLGMKNCFKLVDYDYKIIFETTSPLKALDAIESKKPDVVLTDIRMNKMTGIELMENIREKGLDVDFIVVSGYDDFSYAKEAINYGALHYLLKPLNDNEVIDVLTKLYKHLKKKKE